MTKAQNMTNSMSLNYGSEDFVFSPVLASDVSSIRKAAADSTRINGLTHQFYRYPARFSPSFVSTAIHCLSTPGQIVLDPYMGGGTTIVEATASGRYAVGCDLNSLAVFVSKAKVTALTNLECTCIKYWATHIVPGLSYHTVTDEIANIICEQRTRNLSIPRARPAKKLIALAILSLSEFDSNNARNFARAVLLNVAQWALNNRKVAPSLSKIRERIISTATSMLSAITDFHRVVRSAPGTTASPILIHGTAEDLATYRPFVNGQRADLVVTSPPYPGIHMLYHRWQVDGRKETPAPYWIAGCLDGQGTSYYNFADRHVRFEDNYYEASLKTLKAIRSVMTDGAVMVQMIAFSQPQRQLSRYLENMREAGFGEIRDSFSDAGTKRFRRIWRDVPSRAWHASQHGTTHSSREVVLLHQAI